MLSKHKKNYLIFQVTAMSVIYIILGLFIFGLAAILSTPFASKERLERGQIYVQGTIYSESDDYLFLERDECNMFDCHMLISFHLIILKNERTEPFKVGDTVTVQLKERITNLEYIKLPEPSSEYSLVVYVPGKMRYSSKYQVLGVFLDTKVVLSIVTLGALIFANAYRTFKTQHFNFAFATLYLLLALLVFLFIANVFMYGSLF
jgi:hypothetical protein